MDQARLHPLRALLGDRDRLANSPANIVEDLARPVCRLTGLIGTSSDFGTNSVIDLMGNIIVGIPVGGTSGKGVRPYVTAGLGLIRTQVDGGILFPVSSSNNDFGWNAGLGVMGFFNDHVGLRGDLRYLRTLAKLFDLARDVVDE